MTDEHLSQDDLVDLALFDLDQARTETVTRHLGMCESCHLRYREISDGAELVLAAAPRVAPPPGFSGSVLEAMGFVAEVPLARPRRRTAALLAVAALIGLLAGSAGVLALQTIREPDAVHLSAGAAPITTHDGQQVGAMGGSWYEGQPVYVIAVTGGAQDRSYHCDLLLADGSRVRGGSWQLPAESTATWIVDQPDGGAVGMELLTDGGQLWASATLDG